MNISRFIKNHASTILSCGSAIGVVATFIMAAKAAKKSTIKLKKESKKVGRELTPMERFRTVAPIYAPGVIVGLSTIICLFSADIIARKRQASLISAYIMLDQSYKTYRQKTEALFGEGSDKKIRTAIAKDQCNQQILMEMGSEDRIFYEELFGTCFESTKTEVINAEYQMNRIFATKGFVTMYDFYILLGLKPPKGSAALGWSIGADIVYEYPWIDFLHEIFEAADGMECCSIILPYPPTSDYMEMRENYISFV